jgi:hypothetical protein
MQQKKLQSERDKFVKDGYVILRNAIDKDYLFELKTAVLESLGEQVHVPSDRDVPSDSFKEFSALIEAPLAENKCYAILRQAWINIIQQDLLHKLFTQEKLYPYIADLLGQDICFEDAPNFTLNLPDLSDPNENYFYKDFHQEVWSGSDIHTIGFWTPVFQHQPSGQVALVPGSHYWGHIPHRNRKPLTLPEPLNVVETDLELGDVMLFHTLLLHRTVAIPSNGFPRLALTSVLKNFQWPNSSFERYSNWRILSYSALSKIDMHLGNHQLSPFRLAELSDQRFTDNLP